MGRAVHAAWLVGLLGCGRLGFDAVGDDTTIGPGRDGGTEVLPDASCTWGPWQPPTMVMELSSAFEDSGPAIRFDGLEVVFARASASMGPPDLYHATRSSTDDPFGPAVELTAISAPERDYGPAFSRDGLTLYWSSYAGGIKLWQATRTSLDQAFANPTVLVGTEGPFLEGADPSLRADGLEMVFGDTFGELFRTRRATPNGVFGPPERLPAPVDHANWQEGPSISPDGLTLYFVRDVTASSDFQIHEATRPTIDAPFGTPTAIPVLAGGEAEWDPEVTADGRSLYFLRWNVVAQDIWVTTRDCVP